MKGQIFVVMLPFCMSCSKKRHAKKRASQQTFGTSYFVTVLVREAGRNTNLISGWRKDGILHLHFERCALVTGHMLIPTSY